LIDHTSLLATARTLAIWEIPSTPAPSCWKDRIWICYARSGPSRTRYRCSSKLQRPVFTARPASRMVQVNTWISKSVGSVGRKVWSDDAFQVGFSRCWEIPRCTMRMPCGFDSLEWIRSQVLIVTARSSFPEAERRLQVHKSRWGAGVIRAGIV